MATILSAPTPSSPSPSPPPPCSAPSPPSLSSPRSPSYRNHRLRLSHSCPAPLNPATGSPFYQENWRNLTPAPGVGPFVGGRSLVPMGLPATARTMAFSKTLDVFSLMNVFADWMTSQRWSDLKQLFEF
ncbi:unnamed protein product [Musa hybrid cultivar]